MEKRRAQSDVLFARGSAAIAGGVVSLNRKVDPPLAFVRGKGSRIWDADGNPYIDYHAAFAAHVLGHDHPEVTDAVRAALEEGWSLMGTGTTPWEVQVAEALRAAVPSLDLVQITNTGSEATAHAIRLARAFTGRDDILLTLGGYNGWHNDVARAVFPTAQQVGPRVSGGEYPFVPLSAGIPAAVKQRIHVVNFNDLESVETVLRKVPIACVLTEPVLQNVGVMPPQPGYLQGLRTLCQRHGALLVFDEVKTGFRAALGGYQSIAGVAPDLSVFGKALANGYPMGAIGGRRDVMEQFADPDPAKRVLVAGTFNAHPLPSAAALATLRVLSRDGGSAFQRLESLGAQLQQGLETLVKEWGRPAVVSRIGSAFCLYFADHVPVDLHDLMGAHDFDLDRRFRLGLIQRGIYQFPVAAKQGSVSLAHSEEDLAETLVAVRSVLASL